MSEWEYTTVSLNDRPSKTRPVDVLNDAGEEGWELVMITPNQIAYLKRQIAKRRARPSSSSASATKSAL
jgi:Domain of unknown function (DUF4177)